MLLAIFVFVEVNVFFGSDSASVSVGDRIKVLGCAVAALTHAVWQGSNYLLTLQLQSAFPRIPIYSYSLTNAVKRLRSLSPLYSPPLPPPRHNRLRRQLHHPPFLLAPVGARNLLITSWLFLSRDLFCSPAWAAAMITGDYVFQA